ncbi:putative sodium-coupled neutral amino acid transporter 6 [Chlorella sorokiniana]|uniref:Sodium-coupled neutral amino acid transporter 6 n=1 Tax=Chlorella sorokiniana TaxID=3076 RepID=A0A2P6TJ07_CHLSO|nr:putative sodium-coupled neutral amino acid transporter 6 [Chlorella sorokiniana]|eukprot:PRW39228.1 putative sodium-coupled neutral amino acid transporter 6 [Chlorella sorokiniana]
MGLAKTMLGVGLVALPRSFLLLGALPASLAFLALAALCHLSCSVLAAAAAAAARSGLPAQRLSYSGVLAAQLGPWAAITLDLATVLNCLGMMTAYLIASGDALVSDEWRAAGAPAWLAALLRSRPAVLALLSLAVLAPLLSFRCQVSFYTVVRELGPPATARRMRRASAGAVAVTLVTTLVLAMGSALVFGGSIGPNVLSCFKIAALRELLPGHDRLALVLALTVRLAYLLSLLAAFPLQAGTCLTLQEHLEAPPPQGWRFYALTYSTLVAVSAAAIAVPSIWEPLRLVGATAGAAIAFILPGALALSLAGWRLCSGGGAGGMLLIAVGLLLVVTGIAGTVVH